MLDTMRIIEFAAYSSSSRIHSIYKFRLYVVVFNVQDIILPKKRNIFNHKYNRDRTIFDFSNISDKKSSKKRNIHFNAQTNNLLRILNKT